MPNGGASRHSEHALRPLVPKIEQTCGFLLTIVGKHPQNAAASRAVYRHIASYVSIPRFCGGTACHLAADYATLR